MRLLLSRKRQVDQNSRKQTADEIQDSGGRVARVKHFAIGTPPADRLVHLGSQISWLTHLIAVAQRCVSPYQSKPLPIFSVSEPIIFVDGLVCFPISLAPSLLIQVHKPRK
jgi:hypothetical protein